MTQIHEMDDFDRELMVKVRTAVEYHTNGDPVKDAIDDDEVAQALHLLVQIVDAGGVK
jgi:hypothetical protein